MSTKLKDRIGPNSLHFFERLSVGTEFLNDPVQSWERNPAYQKFAEFVHNMLITNDESERLIRRTVIYGPKDEAGFQAQLQAVGDAIFAVPSCATKKALVASYR